MATLTQIVAAIQGILQDAAYTEAIVVDRINDAVLNIAAGIRMPDGQISPPLPDLYTYGTVNISITLPYVSLPTDYQRQLFQVYDSSGYPIAPMRGGGYYSFNLFLKQISKLDLSEVGSIYRVCVKGNKIFYQGIPTAPTTLGIHYYRKPAALDLDLDTPTGIPDHLQEQVLKPYVLWNIMGEKIEAGVTEPAVGAKYWQCKFYEAMTNLCDFIGTPDVEPQYYGGVQDRGICD